ncbi:phosphoribosylanthranilate isomerase [Paracandidimonas soli]|uniref:phosphoribosylanthranilate isomerase n=1 Tax=Paracandidimonas soli TaxID=1917182 RepID=UPI00333E2707
MSTQRIRVKICGLTREEDVRVAVAAGADAIGMVFYEGSKRCVSLEQARRLRDCVPAFVDVVALFVNAQALFVREVIDVVKPDLLQFHGDESPEECRAFSRRYLRAFRVGAPGLDTPDAVVKETSRYADAAGWLFDSYSAGYGGSGLALDPALLAGLTGQAVAKILAGGLRPDTVQAHVSQLPFRPYALDVSSGVEVSPGIKSPERIQAFMQTVARV